MKPVFDPQEISEDSKKPQAVWISWFWHRRTHSLCTKWRLPLEIVDDGGFAGWRRRVVQILRTAARLLSASEEVVFVQNPSLGLTVVACVIRRIKRFRLVVDAHNEGINPFNRQGQWVRLLTRWLIRSADVTIVTNEELAGVVNTAGGRAVVLPDPLPDLSRESAATSQSDRSQKASVFVIATYSADEPITEILSAAERFKDQIQFVFSGNPGRWKETEKRHLPPNVTLAGFLEERDFVRHIEQAICVVDLSMKPDCLVCGAYEALALGRPAVLTDSPSARRLFPNGFEFVDNTASSIADAIKKIAENPEYAAEAVVETRERYSRLWSEYCKEAHVVIFGQPGCWAKGCIDHDN